MHLPTVNIYCIYILHWETEYPCRLQDMSRFQGVHIKGFYCTCLQFNVLHGSCAEGLHFSALVSHSRNGPDAQCNPYLLESQNSKNIHINKPFKGSIHFI